MSEDIIFSVKGQMGLITLNRAKALNALTLDMVKAMKSQLQEWQVDDNIAAVIIRAGEDSKAFCAGGDVRWLYETGKNRDPQQMQFFAEEYQLNYQINQFSKPYISLLNGITMGGGVGISLHGSYPVATEKFSFAMPETGIGFFPDIGASYLLARCPGSYGEYLSLTGNRLNAEQSLSLGLVKHVMKSEDMASMADELCSYQYTDAVEEEVNSILSKYVHHRIDSEGSDEQVDAFSERSVESILDSLSKIDTQEANGLFQSLMSKAPLSLKVTLEQIRRARAMTFAECLKMDYCLVNHFMQDSDFYEGVRALLVDKDKSPQWNPKKLEDVSFEMVGEYFKTLSNDLIL